MSDFDRNAAAAKWGRPLTRAETTVIDAGLRTYMQRIYNYMVLGLAITGFAALGVFMLSTTGDASLAAKNAAGAAFALKGGKAFLTPFGYALFVSPLKWVVMLAPLALVFFFSFKLESMRPTTAQVTFWIFSALIGMSMASIFLIYTHTSIVRVFFITAAAFGGLSLYGYTTQRDLSGMASFLIMGLIGVIIASLVNIFLGSTMLQFIVSVVGVLVFAGLTAWDTQRLKSEYIYGAMEGDVMEKSAISGALSLYLNFINMFTLLLNLFGQRE
ncbi:MAG: Bax inhibitor-1/YccA family protein [Variibacter sp.]|nr:Bax inhibitor-1/YccA family protein [Variibacter sp.]